MAGQRHSRTEPAAAGRRQWAADRALRPPMRSPGRPEPSRSVQRAFWRLIAVGVTTEDAAVLVGVSTPVATRWFHHAGGMPPISLDEPTGRYLSFAEREEIALLRAQDHGVREIARRIGRDPSTISRELRRNAATRAGQRVYRAGVAQWKAQQAGEAAEDGQARHPPAATDLRRTEAGRSGHRRRREADCGSERAVGRAAARASPRPALGCGLEPRTDQPPAHDRLP